MEPQDKELILEKINNVSKRLSDVEEDVEKIKDEVGDLKMNAGEMKVYISQIFTMLDDIKTQLTVLRDIGNKTREKGDNQWIDFFKSIVFLVIGAVVAYFFKG